MRQRSDIHRRNGQLWPDIFVQRVFGTDQLSEGQLGQLQLLARTSHDDYLHPVPDRVVGARRAVSHLHAKLSREQRFRVYP